MTVDELIVYGKKYLHSEHVKMILADLLNVNSLELLTMLDTKVDEDIVVNFKKKVELVKNNKPIQYVIGNVNFYGYQFKVTEDTLIPRFETEELVENTLIFIDKLFTNKNLKVIDLGCGTGCIGITLKKKVMSLDVSLLDISDKALEIAKINAKNLDVDVNFIKNDMLDGISDKYDIIISNPPYIRNLEKIDSIVSDNEPHIALYGGVDGLDYYKKILASAKNNLNNHFLMAFEIGMNQKNDIINLINQYFDDVEIEVKKDLQQRDRMIFIYR